MSTLILLNSLSGGGAEKAMKTMALALGGTRKLTIVGINSSYSDEVPIECDYYVLERKNRAGIFETITAIIRFRMLLNDIRPKHMIVNCALAELFALFSPSSIKLVVVEHVNPAWEGRALLGYFVRLILAHRASKVIAVSTHLSFSHSKRPVDLVIPNAQKIESSSKSLKLNMEDSGLKVNSLAFVGRLINPQKRPEIALRVALLTELPILFFGDGPERARLESKKDLSFIDVQFKGFHPNVWEEIPPDCLVIVPSLYEGDGLVVTEAILARRPIAISDIPEFRRFILPEQIYFTNAETLAERLKLNRFINFYRPREETCSRLALERDPKSLASKWDNLLSSL